MINGKTYYEILGVLPDAEDIVIRAAYRSLSQKYHPDKWTGDKKFSTERMSSINRSYEILSDATKRAKYDDELGSSKNGTAFDSESDKEDEFQDFYSQSEKDWKLAIEYFPDIDGLFVSLKKINYGLAFGFRQTLIEKKAFANALDIHKKLKTKWLWSCHLICLSVICRLSLPTYLKKDMVGNGVEKSQTLQLQAQQSTRYIGQ